MGCMFSRSPSFVTFFSFGLIINGLFGPKMQVFSSETSLPYTEIDNHFEETHNFSVEVHEFSTRVRHLGFQARAKGYFATRRGRYPNSSSTFNISKLIICGDIELNPGPDTRPSSICKPACSVCNKVIARNHRALSCDQCTLWCHMKCGQVELREYKRLQQMDQFN